MDSFVVKDGKKLRCGYTTGACAAAAAKAAAQMLFSEERIDNVSIQTPGGAVFSPEVLDIRKGSNIVSCAIRKDSGDDPDITNGALIYASITKHPEAGINIDGGTGVGRVTKPGLDQPVGAAAINTVPRKMIRENLQEVCRKYNYHEGLSVIISVPDGEKLAQKTFNPRLGIIGGISILGTTGIVEPMSDRALIETIRLELTQRKANRINHVLLTPGNYGLDFLKLEKGIDPVIPIMVSNFIGDTLDCCRELGFEKILLVGHIGKLVKLAAGMMNTHSRYGDCRMEILASHAAACGLPAAKTAEILECAACDDALRILLEGNLYKKTLSRVLQRITDNLKYRIADNAEIGVILFSNKYGLLCQTENADKLLRIFKGA